LDIDGAVDCGHCGLRQRFEPSTWIEALALAHAVGDLAGPEAEGLWPNPALWIGDDNAFRDVGDSTTFAQLKQSGMEMVDGQMVPRSLQIDACPGHPVCAACRVPVTTTVPTRGVVHTSCPKCRATAVYTMPAGAVNLAPSIVAIVAYEHRSDHPVAKEISAGEGGAVALKCPGCGAPLSAQEQSKILSCKFCGVICRIPFSAMRRYFGEEPKEEIWWVLFSGRSKKRGELDTPPIDVEIPGLPTSPADMFSLKGLLSKKSAVEEAPEQKGPHLAQVMLTTVLALAALLIAFVATFLLRMYTDIF